MPSKRKNERVKPLDHFMVVDRHSEDFIGRVVNLSSGGVKVIGTKPIEKSQLYKCKLTLPAVIDGKSHLEFDAVCKWSEKNDFMHMYETGFQFEDISTKDQDILTTLLEKWCVSKEDSLKV